MTVARVSDLAGPFSADPGPLPAGDALRWLCQLSNASVAVFHQLGTGVHRDFLKNSGLPADAKAAVLQLASLLVGTPGVPVEQRVWLVTQGLSMCASALHWRSYGYPVFDLLPDFAAAAAATDFGDATDQRIGLPFPSFVIRFPNALWGLPRAVLVTPDFRLSREDGAQHLPDGTLLGMKCWDQERTCIHVPSVQGGQLGGTTHSFWTAGTVADIVGGPSDSFQNKVLPVTDDQWSGMGDRIRVIRRILGNTLLYINSTGGLPAPGAKKVGPDVTVEREHAVHPRFRVGRPIKLAPKIRQALTEGNSKGGWKLASRSVVRGHWRNQAVGSRVGAHCPEHVPSMLVDAPDIGPGMLRCPTCQAQRKRLWVQPFWRGPDGVEEAMERLYSVERPQADA